MGIKIFLLEIGIVENIYICKLVLLEIVKMFVNIYCFKQILLEKGMVGNGPVLLSLL